MSLTDVTAPSQTDTIAFEVDLPHAPEKVWLALTNPVLLKEWLLPVTGFSLELGTDFTFQTDPFPGWDGTVSCRVLEVKELEMLRYAWVVGDMVLDTVVSFKLKAVEGGTHLTIEQAGFKPSQKQNFAGARYGWKMMSEKLVETLLSSSESEGATQ